MSDVRLHWFRCSTRPYQDTFRVSYEGTFYQLEKGEEYWTLYKLVRSDSSESRIQELTKYLQNHNSLQARRLASEYIVQHVLDS